jgi:quinol monooxygenase YgiN
MSAVTVGLLVRMTAQPGKAEQVAEFLKGAQALVEAEPDTTSWFAVQLGAQTFGIFDVFPSEEGRQAHLSGKVAEALFQQAPDLFSEEPSVEQVDVLASKLP